MSLMYQRNKFKNLGSPNRSGGYSRRLAINAVKEFVRPNWAVLVAMMLLPGSVALLTTLVMRGSERVKWLYLGVFGVSGIWIVIIFVIIWTGIGSQLMGSEGENFTAVILRKFQKDGWQLVNALKLFGDWDIDHVLVGPAGVLVLETKWSQKEWPVDDNAETYMAGRLEDAVGQVLRNSRQFKSFFKKQLVGVTVTPVCVLWSHSYGSEKPESFQTGGVVIVPGPALEAWMESLTAKWLDSEKVELLSTAVALQVADRDKVDSESPSAPLPTFGTMATRNVVAPLFGFAVSLYGFALLSPHQSLWVNGLIFATFVAVGVTLNRKRALRRIGQGWLAACFGVFCVLIIALIQAYTR